MKALAITDKGLEKVALLELDELIKVKGKAEECVALFNCKSFQDLFKFCYFAQSIERVLLLFDSFSFKNLDDLGGKLVSSVKKIKLKDWFDKKTSFKVECKRMGEHSFGSSTVEKELGKNIIKEADKTLGFVPAVDLDSPDTIFYVFVNNKKAYLGIDFAGRDLSKRQYRVFSSPGVVNANLAFAIARLGGYNGKQKLIDVYSKAGVVCIEAALYASKTSVNYYSKDFAFKKLKLFLKKDWDAFFKKLDSKRKTAKLDILGLDSMLRNIEASKKNSKLAGIDKIINFSKMDVEWLDTKLDKSSVDIIASRIPCPSKHVGESVVRKLYKEMFYQAEFVMKKDAVMALLTEHTGLLRKMITAGFKIIKEDKLWAGKQSYEFLIIQKI